MDASSSIYRLISAADWKAAQAESVVAPGVHDRRDGYMHLSTGAQVLDTARRYFGGRSDVIALEVDRSALGPNLRFEMAAARGEPFPHLYGPLPTGAVLRAQRLRLRDDGSFAFEDGR